MTKTYKPRSISGAIRRIRDLEFQLNQSNKLLEQWKNERILLAKLAATGPAFFNPLEAFAAEKIRDQILASQRINPNGSFRTSR